MRKLFFFNQKEVWEKKKLSGFLYLLISHPDEFKEVPVCFLAHFF